ncbi:MAG: penicillin-binding protein 2 [Myxococcales bacterium]|nr:penicillin-binding protein 2 [Myxococcales bacterium]MDD9965751.1 penicillin-binding protein 2 [Myxococcales bacterium]
MTIISVRREVGEFKKRYKWMTLFVILAFGGIFARLVHLQVIQHDHWAKEARRNITKRVRLPATRGVIRDRHGRVIADNRASYNVLMTPQLLDVDDVQKVGALMQLSPEQLEDLRVRLSSVSERRRSHLIQMFSDITRDQYAALETHNRELPGLTTVGVPMRRYPFDGLAAHTIGYLNEVNAEDLKRFPEAGYRAGHHIGRMGIERAWESYLRGRDGELKVVVDVRGREFEGARLHKKSERREPIPGRDLTLTLDMGLMRAVQRAFRGHPSGAAVVVDVHTGYLLALFSKPSYDLNEMSGRLTVARAQEIQKNPFRPLIDKTIYESYFPGSTFKPISALTALQDAVYDGTERCDCPGYYELGGRKFRCGHSHGDTDLRKAIVQSCNVYFYRLGQAVGLDRLGHYARMFGFGEPSGLGLNTEAKGFFPTKAWYRERYGARYRLGFTINAAIGQGDTRVTLVQLAMAYAAIANGGTLYVPQVVRSVDDPDGTSVAEFGPRVRRQVDVDPDHLKKVTDGMHGVVNDMKGTAFGARVVGGVPMAGKTGTAQVAKRKLQPGEDPRRAWYYRRSHAWFAGFAPARDPKLAVVVLVEHGGDGGKNAAPIATQVLQHALGKEEAATHTASQRRGFGQGRGRRGRRARRRR